jgi:outer membrane protein OmpA-like peptidoglycan-associated protein
MWHDCCNSVVIMANVSHEERLRGDDRHRAHETHVHRRPWRRAFGALLGLPALAIVPGAVPPLPAQTAPQQPDAQEPAPAEAPGVPPTPPEKTTSSTVAQAHECSQATVYFPTDGALINTEGVDTLNAVADCLGADPSRIVLLEGRTDPSGTDEHNRDLAFERADTVANQLVALGVSTDRISVTVRPPPCTEATASCWRRGRTVTALLLPRQQSSGEQP